MKILHIIASIRQSAGTTVFVIELCEQLRALGLDSIICVEIRRPTDTPTELPVIEETELAALANSIDCVHVHGVWSPSTHRMMACVKNAPIPCVLSPHGMLTPWALNFRKWKKKIAMWLYQKSDLARADLFHVTAEAEEEDIRRLGYTQPCVIAPLGVTLPASTARIPKYGRIVLFLSRVHPKKGLKNLIAAWSMIKSRPVGETQAERWRVVIAGPDEVGHIDDLKRDLAKCGLSYADCQGSFAADNLCGRALDVDFIFTGAVFGEEKDRLHRMADVFVLPSFSENFGVVVPDAMSYGLPVITTKGTPWSELTGNPVCPPNGGATLPVEVSAVGSGRGNRCGWWVDIGVEPLYTALKEAVGLSDEQRSAMGAIGRRIAESKYTWGAVARTMRDAYQSLLDERPRGKADA